jgi:hypothetical protein
VVVERPQVPHQLVILDMVSMVVEREQDIMQVRLGIQVLLVLLYLVEVAVVQVLV